MKSPLETYKDLAQKFGVTESMQVPNVAKLSFVRAQEQEQQAIINRLLVDLTMTLGVLDEAKDENTKAAITQKVHTYENDLRQLVSSLKFSQELVKELEASVKE